MERGAMKKNIILSLCIAAVLLACFADGYFRKDRAWQTFSGAWQEDNGAGSGAQNDAGTALENGVQNGAETALGSSAQSGIGTVQENSVPASAGTVSGNSAQNGAGNGAQNGAGTAQENSVQNGAGTASGNSARIRVTRDIRVLIKTAGFQSVYHDCVTVDTDSGFSIVGGSSRKSCPPGEAVFSVASEEFQGSGILRLIAQDGQFHVKNLNRERQSDVYSGILELRRMDEGILLINELPLEDYLTGVVSSEMPSYFTR